MCGLMENMFGEITSMYIQKADGCGLHMPAQGDTRPLENESSQGWMVLGSRPLERKIIFL
ncbi:MAG: hypothetical protein ABI863_01230 [Ginsengibacter sp.]